MTNDKLDKKTNKLQLRLSDGDLLKVKKAAFEANLTVSQFVRQSLIK